MRQKKKRFVETRNAFWVKRGEQLTVPVKLPRNCLDNRTLHLIFFRLLLFPFHLHSWILFYEGPVQERGEWQEKLAYIQSYLEQSKDSDSHSNTTETSDSGMTESHGATSEIGVEETSGKILLMWIKVSVKICVLDRDNEFFSLVILLPQHA